MKFGFRTPSLKKRIAARTSVKRYVRHNLGVKAPKGMGALTNPKKAAYNKAYNKLTADPFKTRKSSTNTGSDFDADTFVGCLTWVVILVAVVVYFFK